MISGNKKLKYLYSNIVSARNLILWIFLIEEKKMVCKLGKQHATAESAKLFFSK